MRQSLGCSPLMLMVRGGGGERERHTGERGGGGEGVSEMSTATCMMFLSLLRSSSPNFHQLSARGRFGVRGSRLHQVLPGRDERSARLRQIVPRQTAEDQVIVNSVAGIYMYNYTLITSIVRSDNIAIFFLSRQRKVVPRVAPFLQNNRRPKQKQGAEPR